MEEKFDNFFNLYRFRDLKQANYDLFSDYEFDPSSISDLNDAFNLTNTMRHMTKVCFKDCADLGYKYFTKSEKKCIRSCVNSQLKSFMAF